VVVLARVTNVIDGDTADVRILESRPGLGPRERVRYLGINAPESYEPGYYEATLANRELVRFRDVYLEFDRQLRDAHGRLLAYLWVAEDGEWIMVNERLVELGLAKILFIPPNYLHAERLRAAELRAQIARRGIWAEFLEPLSLSELEAGIVRYVTKVVEVAFTVAAVEEVGDEVWLRALDSALGFHVVLEASAFAALGEPPEVGQQVSVRGELRFERLSQGPYIRVLWPEQLLR
jgi:micrococcal nuclease